VARLVAVAGAVILLIGVGTVAAIFIRSRESVQPQIRFEIPASFPVIPNGDPEIAVSPDGQRIALVLVTQGRSQISIRALAESTPHPVAGTEGASYPFWAPNGRAIAFFADGKLKRIEFDGGTPQVLAVAPAGRGGAWSADDQIAFAPSTQGPLMRIRAGGGEPIALTRLEPRQTGHSQPSFVPSSAYVLFRVAGSPEVAGLYAVGLDGTPMHRLAVGVAPTFVGSDRLLFLRQNALYAQRFDPQRLALVGDAIRLVDAVSAYSASMSTLVYRGATQMGQQLTWFDRGGRTLGTVGPPDANVMSVELSPDETRVAVHRDDGIGNADVWLIDVTRNVMTRMTFDSANDRFPLWAPDGRHVIFDSNRSGGNRLYEKAVEGSDPEQQLKDAVVGSLAAASDWSHDGKFILYRTTAQPGTLPNLWALPITDGGKPFAWATTPFDQFNGQFAPDTQWVAYGSDETGRYEVYIQSFPKAGVKYRVSTDGGVEPRWRRDGKELFYVAPDGSIMAINVRSIGQGLELSKPAALFQGRPLGGFSNTVRIQYAVTRDGQRFLVNSTRPGDLSTTSVVVNWQEELKQRVSTR
jgi:Tol biopolymer transport system component